MKKFIRHISYLLLPLLILELCITLIKDPGEIVSQRYQEIKDILISNKNARLYSVPSQWGKFQEAYVQARREQGLPVMDIVTWGSSRSSEIRADLFPNNISYYNCVIPGSNILDYVSLYELYKEYDYVPQTVIINIDPWTFYERKDVLKDGQTYYVKDEHKTISVKDHLNGYLMAGMKDLKQPLRGLSSEKSIKNNLLRYVELLSPSYFQSSLKVIFQSPVAAVSENYIPNYFVIRKDGSYTLYEPDREEMDRINSRAANFGKLAAGNFYGDDCSEGENMKLFISLVDQLKKNQVHIVLFISPLHPSLYDALEGYEKKSVEHKLNALAKEKGLLVIGSYNPHLYNLSTAAKDPDFLDEYHVSYKAMKTIFAAHQLEISKKE